MTMTRSGTAKGELGEVEVQGLVGRAQRGEREVFGALYKLHVERVYRAVRPMCGSDAEADDIVQDTFVSVFRGLGSYRPRKGARFISWVLVIAMNKARLRFRPAARSQVATEPSTLAELGDRGRCDGVAQARAPEDDMEDLKRRALLRALSELGPMERRVLTLRYAAEVSAAEVGMICNLSEGNVRKICQRQRAALLGRVKALLQEWDEGERPSSSPPPLDWSHEKMEDRP